MYFNSDVKTRRKNNSHWIILTFVPLRPYAISFLGLLSLTLMPKSERNLETSLYLTPLFKTSVDARVEGLVSNWIIWKIGAVILFKRNIAEKDVAGHIRFVLWTVIFLFVRLWEFPKVKKNKQDSLQTF